MVMDCGQHMLKGWPEPQKVHSILVPGLEERARMLGPLSTFNQISPGASLAVVCLLLLCFCFYLPWHESGISSPDGTSCKDLAWE